MGLWLMNVDALDDDIETACKAAHLELQRRGIPAHVAQEAALDAIDLAEDYEGEETPRANAVVAWHAAEDAAFRTLDELTGEWPHVASLVYWNDEHAVSEG